MRTYIYATLVATNMLYFNVFCGTLKSFKCITYWISIDSAILSTQTVWKKKIAYGMNWEAMYVERDNLIKFNLDFRRRY